MPVIRSFESSKINNEREVIKKIIAVKVIINEKMLKLIKLFKEIKFNIIAPPIKEKAKNKVKIKIEKAYVKYSQVICEVSEKHLEQRSLFKE